MRSTSIGEYACLFRRSYRYKSLLPITLSLSSICFSQLAGTTDHSLFISISSSLAGLYSEWTYLTPFISSLSIRERTNISLNVTRVGSTADRLRVLDYTKNMEESNKLKVKT